MQNSPRLLMVVEQQPRADASLVIRADEMHGPILARLDIDEDAGHLFIFAPQTAQVSFARGQTILGLERFRWAGT